MEKEKQIAKCRKVIKQNLTELFFLLKDNKDLYAYYNDDFISFVENNGSCGYYMMTDHDTNKVRFHATVSTTVELEKDVFIKLKESGKCKKI